MGEANAERQPTRVSVLRGLGIAIIVLMAILMYVAIQVARQSAKFSNNKNNMKQLGLAVHNYHDFYDQLPISTRNQNGTDLQGWPTTLLPWISNPGPVYFERDFRQPWDAEAHRELFQIVFPWYLSPSTEQATDPATGYALTSYSANKHLIDFGPAVAFEDIKDGLATTLLIGEIRDELPPWGKPGNSRDPALGINKSPQGFGGTFYNGCLFAMADGSVRHISETVDTKVIEALGTPAGGEKVSDDEF